MLSQMLFAPREAHAQATPAAPTTIAVGDWQLKPLVEVRTRAEYRRDAPDLGGFDLRGALGPRVRSAWDAAERSRLGLGVEHGAVRAQVTLQDARALGTSIASATLGPARAPAQVGAYEAYLEARTAAARGAMLRLGRQAVVWGEGRLVGDADFSPTGRSLDAARGHVAFGNVDVEALAVILEAPGPLGSSFAQRSGPSYSGVQLYGLMGRYTVDPLLRIELFAFARVARSSGEALDGSRFAIARSSGELYTGSLRISGEAKGWDHGIEGAYQLGTAASLAVGGSDVRAFALAGHLQKTLPEVRLTPTFRVSASYASGDDGRGTYTQFDPLLPDPQRFHGQMDLFAWSNAVDLAGRAQIVPWTDTSFGLEYRYARLARTGGEWVGSYLQTVGSSTPASGYGHAGYAPITGAASAELGHEIDVSFAWRPYVPLELRVGWSGLLLGDGARRIMAGMARGRTDAVNDVEAARIAQYAFAQATLAMP
ncbi:MAG: hypothetical protein JWP97_2970 [Labilithrix sp.]|nr:hypothetical protein [Labilithrix sp.]